MSNSPRTSSSSYNRTTPHMHTQPFPQEGGREGERKATSASLPETHTHTNAHAYMYTHMRMHMHVQKKQRCGDEGLQLPRCLGLGGRHARYGPLLPHQMYLIAQPHHCFPLLALLQSLFLCFPLSSGRFSRVPPAPPAPAPLAPLAPPSRLHPCQSAFLVPCHEPLPSMCPRSLGPRSLGGCEQRRLRTSSHRACSWRWSEQPLPTRPPVSS